ncbi:hypothetical protein L1987_06083 [Smallanthus sonchifolius]|uniref:Uncharacterized protein n=1 Tax=Smallanthus sonchifolius TaxID=185202 RepID=A0ACB9JX77_9ASTR|nr:hypothetical protein L1987_06083 [Smallanthus sonchifolius]
MQSTAVALEVAAMASILTGPVAAGGRGIKGGVNADWYVMTKQVYIFTRYDEGKLFIGGIAWDTIEETLTDYFSKYDVVSQTVIMRDKTTGRPRGFGFVVFSDPSVIDSVLQDRHTIEGRTVEAIRALSREEQQTSSPNNFGRSSGGTGNYRTKKIFVGGLPSTLTEEQFRQYFENYGEVTDVVII